MQLHIHSLIQNQHQEVKDTYDLYQRTSSKEEKDKLAKKILTDLTVHAALEEEIYYPELKKRKYEDTVTEFEAEHQNMKLLISKLTIMNRDSAKFDPNLKALMEAVSHHVEEEEQKMPAIEKVISKERLYELGEKFEEQNEELHNSMMKRLWATLT